MILKIIAIRDRAADAFGIPNFTASIGAAMRSFADEINSPRENNQLNRHPEDFDLYELGTYNDNTGHFDVGVPRQIAIGKDLVQKEQA